MNKKVNLEEKFKDKIKKAVKRFEEMNYNILGLQIVSRYEVNFHVLHILCEVPLSSPVEFIIPLQDMPVFEKRRINFN